MRRITLVVAIAGVAGGCGSADSGSHGGSTGSGTTSYGSGSTAGSTATAPAITGGAGSGPAITGGSVSGPSTGAGGTTSGPSAGNGGATSLPAVGSGVSGGARIMSCSQVAAYATTLGTPSSCSACLESSCCASLLACYYNADCLTYAQCVSSCNSGSPSAGSSTNCGCDAQYPNGVDAFNKYGQCVFGSCQSECVTVTVTMGNGSSGGTSCLNSGTSCIQNGDCCSNVCSTATSSGATGNYCQ